MFFSIIIFLLLSDAINEMVTFYQEGDFDKGDLLLAKFVLGGLRSAFLVQDAIFSCTECHGKSGEQGGQKNGGQNSHGHGTHNSHSHGNSGGQGGGKGGGKGGRQGSGQGGGKGGNEGGKENGWQNSRGHGTRNSHSHVQGSILRRVFKPRRFDRID